MAVLPPSRNCPPGKICADDIASAILVKLVELDSLWDLTHSVCDRYLDKVAA